MQMEERVCRQKKSAYVALFAFCHIVFFGVLRGARTLDPLIKSQLLYQLS